MRLYPRTLFTLHFGRDTRKSNPMAILRLDASSEQEASFCSIYRLVEERLKLESESKGGSHP